VGDPGIHQCLADDKDRCDQNHGRVAKARQGFARREHLAQHQRQHDEDSYDIDAWTSPGEQHDGACQYAENRQHRACHGRVSLAESAGSSASLGAPRLPACTPRTTQSVNTSAVCAGTIAKMRTGRRNMSVSIVTKWA